MSPSDKDDHNGAHIALSPISTIAMIRTWPRTGQPWTPKLPLLSFIWSSPTWHNQIRPSLSAGPPWSSLARKHTCHRIARSNPVGSKTALVPELSRNNSSEKVCASMQWELDLAGWTTLVRHDKCTRTGRGRWRRGEELLFARNRQVTYAKSFPARRGSTVCTTHASNNRKKGSYSQQ